LGATQENVLKVLKLLGTLFYNMAKPRQSFLILYQTIALEFSEATASELSNSLGVCMVNMRTYILLSSPNISVIRSTLKAVKSYDDNKIEVSEPLLALSLNNLAVS
jgi:hypothetical protein